MTKGGLGGEAKTGKLFLVKRKICYEKDILAKLIQNNNLIYTDHGRPFFGGGMKTIKLQFDKFFSGNVVERDFFYREVCTTRTFSKLVREDFFFKDCRLYCRPFYWRLFYWRPFSW